MSANALLVELLSTAFEIPQQEIDDWQYNATKKKQTLFQYIMQQRLLNPNIFSKKCAEYFNKMHVKVHEIENTKIDVLDSHHFILILKNKNNILLITNPDDLTIKESFSKYSIKKYVIAFLPYDTLAKYYNKIIGDQLKHAFESNLYLPTKQTTQLILSNAIHQGASDIHIETYADQGRIRFRIDGLLHHEFTLSKVLLNSIISCIKVLSKLDIAIKRIPQDGRALIRTNIGFVRNARVSTYPTYHGEKLVLRLLEENKKLQNIDALGLSDTCKNIILKTLSKPQGLILVTGPTGSGKTITLYTMLELLNQTQRNISTIEDPIEIDLPGINQSQISPKIGFDFIHAMRALLRQDPDVIMIGEIRDTGTAQIAIRAAQTGHLVLSTLHTNSISETITRLTSLGIHTDHLKYTISLIIAQRLVRRLCALCKTPRGTLYEAKGCQYCRDGYQGRIGVYTLSSNETLWQAACKHVQSGKTSLSEIRRVIPKNE